MTGQELDRVLHLARISAELLAQPEEDATARSIVTKSTEFVPGCTAATLVQTQRGRPSVLAATDGATEELEQLSLASGEGPTEPPALWPDGAIVVRSEHEARWPGLSQRLRERGVTAMVALLMVIGTERLGWLDLYTTAPAGFGIEAVGLAEAFGFHASVALFAAQKAAALSGAVDARHRVGLAQGILVSRYGISKETAFQLLRRYSNSANIKLRDVATQVYEKGDLPPAHRPSGRIPAPRRS